MCSKVYQMIVASREQRVKIFSKYVIFSYCNIFQRYAYFKLQTFYIISTVVHVVVRIARFFLLDKKYKFISILYCVAVFYFNLCTFEKNKDTILVFILLFFLYSPFTTNNVQNVFRIRRYDTLRLSTLSDMYSFGNDIQRVQ